MTTDNTGRSSDQSNPPNAADKAAVSDRGVSLARVHSDVAAALAADYPLHRGLREE